MRNGTLLAACALGLTLTAGPLLAQDADAAPQAVERPADRPDRGDRVERRYDRQGDMIDRRLDRAARHAEANDHELAAQRLDRRGDGIDRRMDRRGREFDRRFDRRQDRRQDRRD